MFGLLLLRNMLGLVLDDSFVVSSVDEGMIWFPQPWSESAQQKNIFANICFNAILNPFMWYAYRKGFSTEFAWRSTIRALIVSIEISRLWGARENITSTMYKGSQQIAKKRTVMRSTIVVWTSRVLRSPSLRGLAFILQQQLQRERNMWHQFVSLLSPFVPRWI